MEVAYSSLMSLLIPDRHNMLLSVCIFVEPECPKCIASTNSFFNFSWIRLLSPTNNKPNRSIISLKTGDNSPGARFFCSFRRTILNCKSSGSTEVLWIGVFKSTAKPKFSFWRIFSASAFMIFDCHLCDLLEQSVPFSRQCRSLSCLPWENLLLVALLHFPWCSTHSRAIACSSPHLHFSSVR